MTDRLLGSGTLHIPNKKVVEFIQRPLEFNRTLDKLNGWDSSREIYMRMNHYIILLPITNFVLFQQLKYMSQIFPLL